MMLLLAAAEIVVARAFFCHKALRLFCRPALGRGAEVCADKGTSLMMLVTF
jgi:hypothetical protein